MLNGTGVFARSLLYHKIESIIAFKPLLDQFYLMYLCNVIQKLLKSCGKHVLVIEQVTMVSPKSVCIFLSCQPNLTSKKMSVSVSVSAKVEKETHFNWDQIWLLHCGVKL